MVFLAKSYLILACLVLGSVWSFSASAQEETEPATEPTAEPPAEPSTEPAPESAPESAEDHSQLPKLTSHSETELAIFQGDKLSLKVEADGEKLLYRWVRNYKTICTDTACEFDSSRWGLGKQNITFVVYNRYGSRTVTFLVKVMARTPEHEPTQVTPELISASEVETLSREDLYIRAVRGIGYSYVNRNVNVVAQISRKISWQEAIKTHVRGTLMFGRRGAEEHLVLPNSGVRLFTNDSGRRGIILMDGAVRSRQMSSTDPAWSVLVEDWLQVDGDNQADVLVERKGKNGHQAQITVFRGHVILSQTKPGAEGGDGEVEKVVVPTGVSIFVSKGKDYPAFKLPPAKTTFENFNTTSPQYLPRKEPSKQRNLGFLTGDSKERFELKIEDALKKARELEPKNDAILMLEYLLPHLVAGDKNFDFNMLMGSAYARLGLFKLAYRFYAAAGKLEPKSSEPAYQIGRLYVLTRNWAKGIEWLERADSLKHKDWQAVHYYLGVARYNLSQSHTARNHFRYSLWRVTNKEIQDSARNFLILIDDDRWLGAYGRLLYGRDSNVYRWGKDVARLEGYETVGSGYYLGELDIFVRGFSSEGGSFTLGFDIEKIYYAETALKDLGPLTQELYADWVLNLGTASADRPVFSMNMRPYVRLLSVGEERSADSMGMKLRLGLPRFWLSPSFVTDYATVSDPLPGRDDKIDPILREPVLPSDRSGVLTAYGLDLEFTRSASGGLVMYVLNRSVVHSEEAVKVDDFSEMEFGLRGESMTGERTKLFLSAGSGTRAFAESSDSRKDTYINLDLGFKCFFSPSFFLDLSGRYETQKSNRDVAAYVRLDWALGFGLEL